MNLYNLSHTAHLSALGLCATLLATAQQSAQADPPWWPKNTSATVDNYRPANAGQLKNMAAQAKTALDSALAPFGLPGGGAGEELTRMISAWPLGPDPKNGHVINQAQLKAVAKPFYDRLAQLQLWERGWIPALNPPLTPAQLSDPAGRWHRIRVSSPVYAAEWSLTPRYPWKFWVPASFWAQQDRSTLGLQPANVGQMKAVFDFDAAALLSTRSYTLTLNGTPVTRTFLTAGVPTDSDGDGVSDLVEFLLGADPADAASFPASTNPYAGVTPQPTVNPTGLSDASASRFLSQAAWGPAFESITDLKSKGITLWLDEQLEENHADLGFRPQDQGMTQITWQDGSTSRWQVLWQEGWGGSTATTPVDNRLFQNFSSINGRPEEYWQPILEAGKGILPALFAISAQDVQDRWNAGGWWGTGGVMDYVNELVAGQSTLTLQNVTDALNQGYTPAGGAAIPGVWERQHSAFYGRLDGQWQMSGTVGGQQVTLPYSGYQGPAPTLNSSNYPGNLAVQTPGNATWAALRDVADPQERGPYAQAWFPKRGVEPYTFYLHWRKLVLDRPLWQAALQNGWIQAPHHLTRVLPWCYTLGDVWSNDVQTTTRAAWGGLDEAWLRRALHDPDQLRQRVAWALSQILVVSNYQNFAQERVGIPAVGHYDDLLNYRAFRRFEDLLLDVTFHPLMAHWLTYIGSKGAVSVTDTALHPDENYAREIMQLFSMGLHELHDDGTPKLDARGNKVFTYTQEDVRQLARVFTGMVSRTGVMPADCLPLKVDPELHDVRSKSFLGLTLPANASPTSASAEAEIRTAVRHIATRPSVAPYICRQLIQHLVTSNPSPGYVRRVVAVWRSQYTQSDHLGRVVRAILTDAEARSADTALTSLSAGRMKPPMQRLVGLMRAFHAGAEYAQGGYDLKNPLVHPLDGPLWGWGHYLGTGEPAHLFNDFQQMPFLSPSVFSFYAPGFSPSGEVFNSRLLGPEFQLLNSATAATVTARLWLDTDAVLPVNPYRAPADGYGGLPVKTGELVLNMVGSRFAQAQDAGGNPVGSLLTGTAVYDHWLPAQCVPGFSGHLYHSGHKELFTRLWHQPPYLTPGSGMTHQGRALRVHFGTLDPDGDGNPATGVQLSAPAISGTGSPAAEAFLDQLDLLLCAGRMAPATRARLRTVIQTAAATPGDAFYRERAALQLLLMAPEASVIR
jgi:uncharacterized protein (DUF1800 family)